MPNLNNPIQRFFWTNLTREGLDLVDASRVERLVDFVKQHQVTEQGEAPDPSDAGTIDAFEAQALRHLLEDNNWRGLLTDDGVKKLESVLGIQVQVYAAGEGRDATGEVPKGSIRQNQAGRIGRTVRAQDAAALFRLDYGQNRWRLYENPSIPRDERAKNVLYLLQDYAKQLHAVDADYGARKALLAAFFEAPLAGVYGSADPDDDLLNTAWEIVWGTDAEKPESGFDIDPKKRWTAYMSMDGTFVSTAKKVDAYLAATGQPAKVEHFENLSPLNWIVGDTPGNTKASSSFREASAIRSTGVDFAAKLIDESALEGRSLDPSYDLKVDFYAWGNFVALDERSGERLVARHDETGADLQVEIERVGDAHWRPVFKDAAGATIEPYKVTAVIIDRAGQVKGDGKATGTYSASWWGFCDRNAMMGLVTQKYGFPKPSRDVTLKEGEQSFTFLSSDIANIVGRRLTEIFPTNTFAGSRFDDEPDQIALKDGSVLQGKIKTAIDFYRPDTVRQGDVMIVTPDMDNPPRGSLWVELKEERRPGADPTFATGERDVDVTEIREVRRGLQSGSGALERDAATLILNDGTELDVRLKSKVDFSRAERLADGALVVKNSDEHPLLGDLAIHTVRGKDKRVPLSDVQYVTREDQNEILAEEALSYIVRNQGIFCADSWTHSSVANGTRTIEEIKRWSASDPNKPNWVPDDLASLKGYRGPVTNPDKLLFFSLGNKGSFYGGVRFWIELDDNGIPKNSKIVSGQWDFLWGVEGKPDWGARATFNPNMPEDLVLKLYVNSVEDPEAMADLLPDGWREHLLPTS